MWNLKRRKKDNTDINAEGSKHIQTRKKNNAGFTLVELLVAVTVFGLMVTPLMSAFVVSSRINLKGRQQEQALTIAQNLMEGLKEFGIADLAKQINTNSITIVSNGDGAGYQVAGTDLSSSYVSGVFKTNDAGGTSDPIFTHKDDSNQDVYETVDLGKYEYILDNILMGSTYYDAYITITQINDTAYLLPQTVYYKALYAETSATSLKYYSVDIEVYVADIDHLQGTIDYDSNRASYSGTFLCED